MDTIPTPPEVVLAAINDLRVALQNMCQVTDADRARKQIKRSKDIASRYARADGGEHVDAAQRIVSILDDASKMLHHAKSLDAYIQYVSNECLEVLDQKVVK